MAGFREGLGGYSTVSITLEPCSILYDLIFATQLTA